MFSCRASFFARVSMHARSESSTAAQPAVLKPADAQHAGPLVGDPWGLNFEPEFSGRGGTHPRRTT